MSSATADVAGAGVIVDDLIAGFADSHDLVAVLHDPVQAAGLCVYASEAFALFAHGRGVRVAVVDVFATGAGAAPEGFAHTVAVVGDRDTGVVVDWTYRQIDPDAPVPLVVPVGEFFATWR